MSKIKSRIELDKIASNILSETTTQSKNVVFECPYSKIINEKTSYKGVDKDMYIFTRNSKGGAFVVAEKESKILLISQYRSASKTISYEVPAGNIDIGEDPANAAKRELVEETGFYPEQLIDIGTCFVAPGFSNLKSHYFLATNLTVKEKNREPAETILDQDFFSLEEINEMIQDGRINDGPTITATHYYTLYKNKNG